MFKHKILAAVTGALLCSAAISSTALAADGAALYKEKTCIACHGAEGKSPAMNAYPILAGQHSPYLLEQMRLIKSGVRANSHSVAMKNIMHLVSEEEMLTIAKWLADIK